MLLDNCFQGAPFGQSFITEQFSLLDYQLQKKHVDMDEAELVARVIKSWSKKWGLWLTPDEEVLLACLLGGQGSDVPLGPHEINGLLPRKEDDDE